MKRIGKYEICGLLGKGGMSSVYRARLPVADKLVALKLLNPHPHLSSLWGAERIRELFVREARAIAALRHPNVVEVLDFDFVDGRPFFTMEYYFQSLGMILGESNVVELPCRVLPIEKVIQYTRQLLGGLARLHRAGLVHRDIKPYNLLITEEDRLKICDFGLSRLRGEPHPSSSGSVIIGSPFYAAPEQERNPDHVDPRSDLFSVGVVVSRMLTGRFPDAEGLARISGRVDAGEAWCSFVARAASPDVGQRPPSAQHMLEALRALESMWRVRQELLCRSIEQIAPGPSSDREALRRSIPLKVTLREAPQVFGCDALLQPLVPSRSHFEIQPGGKLILDRSTHLLWERVESPDPVTWNEALARVSRLNGEHFAGLESWRLPTVPEVLSLARYPARAADACESGPFDTLRRWFWTCDRKSFCASWYVDTELGYAGWGDHSCRYHARAVSSQAGK